MSKPVRYTFKSKKEEDKSRQEPHLDLIYSILLSCPGCGSEPVAKQSFGWFVICPKCGLKTAMHVIKQVAYLKWNKLPRKNEGVF